MDRSGRKNTQKQKIIQMKNSKEKEYEQIRKKIKNCKKCSLWKTRTNTVTGQGNLKTKVMFIGEAPGAQEDKKGYPFCGKAGKILDELLDSVGIKREEIYITNILKCRPPRNRNPKKNEIKACILHLEKQIEIIQPRVICTLGNYSTAYIFNKYGLEAKIRGISLIHGKIFEPKGFFSSLRVVPFYHPAAAAYNPRLKKTLKKDFKTLKRFFR